MHATQRNATQAERDAAPACRLFADVCVCTALHACFFPVRTATLSHSLCMQVQARSLSLSLSLNPGRPLPASDGRRGGACLEIRSHPNLTQGNKVVVDACASFHKSLEGGGALVQGFNNSWL